MANKQDLSKLKAAWEKQSKGGGNFKFWKPRENGEYTIRFLPPHDSDGLFFKQTAQYKLGDKYFFAPYIEGNPDPVYEYYRALWKKDTAESKALAREIKPRKQYLYNIVVRDENGAKPENPTKVFVYMSGQKLYDKVMHYFWDEDFGDLTDIEEGFDFKIVKEGNPGGFPSYDNSRPRNKMTTLFEDDSMTEEVLAGVHNLNEEVEYKSYEELKQALQDFLNSKTDTESFFDNVDNAPSAPKGVKEAVVAKKATKTVEAADDDLDDFEKKLLAEIEDDQ